MIKTYSIRKRLLLYICVPSFIVSIVTLLIVFLFTWQEIEEVYDVQLVNSTRVLLQLLEHEIIEETSTDNFNLQSNKDKLNHKYERNIALRIWHKNKIISQSKSSIEFKGLQAPPRFSDQIINGDKWRFFVYIDSDTNIRIEISERYSIRYEMITKILSSVVVPIVIFIPVLIFIIWNAINKSVKPLVSISSTVEKRNSDDLSPIPSSNIPEEIASLVNAINRLFYKIRINITKEKEFIDNAAHELRTPLAAMKTQAQVIQKRAIDDPLINEDIHYLLHSIDRSSYLVDQLLLFSRLQASQLPKKDTVLSDLLDDILQQTEVINQNKRHTINLSVSNNIYINAHKESISIMLKNLIENAIKYTPKNGYISIKLNDSGLLTILDSGPGIENENLEKVFERFYRDDKTGEKGSGLGLSISKWIADVHSLSILLSKNEPAGLMIEIDFSGLLVSK